MGSKNSCFPFVQMAKDTTVMYHFTLKLVDTTFMLFASHPVAKRIKLWPVELAISGLIPAGDGNHFYRKRCSFAYSS